MIVVDLIDHDVSIEDQLVVLKRMATSTLPVRIKYGGKFESSFSWRITNLDWTSQRRGPNNAITQAEVTMEFSIAKDVKLTSGPLSGGASKGGSKKYPYPSKSKGKSTKTRTYTVKKGDTLSSISMRLFKTTKKWRYLADKNKIKDPRKLRVGQKLKY